MNFPTARFKLNMSYNSEVYARALADPEPEAYAVSIDDFTPQQLATIATIAASKRTPRTMIVNQP